ncbi:protein translocase subunit SecDF [Clostridia bacterium]|nr:protein translocase subunit SecDF [Clostridia bacterium]
MKKIVAVVVTVIIAFAWIITVKGIGPVGPIQNYLNLGLDIKGGVYVVMEAQTEKTGAELQTLMEQVQSIIDRRVNEMGMSEPVITIEGENRIRVELPGAEDSDQAIDTIGKTAILQFVLADGTVAFDGSEVTNSAVQNDPDHGGYLITLEFNAEGAQDFADATTKAYNREVPEPFMEGITSADQIAIVLDGEIISAPSVNEPISGGSAVITRPGGFSQEEAIQTSTLIRAGALPVELIEVESSAIGATLGLDALTNSIIGGAIGILLVILIMLILYRIMGLSAVLALLLYVPMVFWIIVGLRGVLTLPGIAGIILSIGMAVDANVIIFARIKEEVAGGKSLRVSAGTGFRKAISTIIDSQITTLIAGVVLYQFGTGPVRGFALTLIIGILVSLFTALAITNLYVNVFVGNGFMVKHGWLGVREGGGDNQGIRLKQRFSFLKHRKIYYIVTVVILVVGLGVGIGRGFNMGIDFTGGTMLQVELGKTVPTEDVRASLTKNNIADADIVHFGDGDTGVIIKTTQALTADDRAAILATLEEDFGITDNAIQSFEQFGPSVGKMLTNNAIRAVLLAALFMLIYVVIRFKFKFGAAALITTFHDVAITVAMYGLFNLTINNPFIAAILTVVGYSINDTIVIFDRIRENLGLMRKTPLNELIDTSINQTLVRSLMTSLTTIAAILPLVFIGGESIRQFAVPLIIGIAAGTCSSIFIASSLFYDMSKGSYKESGKGGKYQGAERKGSTPQGDGNRPKSKKSRAERKGDGAVV